MGIPTKVNLIDFVISYYDEMFYNFGERMQCLKTAELLFYVRNNIIEMSQVKTIVTSADANLQKQ
jgi:hypothetical protein